METYGGQLPKKNHELSKSTQNLPSHLRITSWQPWMFEVLGFTLQRHGSWLWRIRERTQKSGNGKRSERRLWTWWPQINEPTGRTAARTCKHSYGKQKSSKISSKTTTERKGRMGRWWSRWRPGTLMHVLFII